MDITRVARPTTISAREAAYLAYLASLKEQSYISDALNGFSLEPKEHALAYEIAQGACRMALALDHIAKALSEKKALSLKLKEKALLRIALYQLYYLGNSPKHAIGDESVKLAKKYTSQFFAKFLNALIRKSEGKKEDLLPQGEDVEALSIRTSFPLDFVKRVPKEVLETLNKPPRVMARKAGTDEFILIDTKEKMAAAITGNEFYIQNRMPITLMNHLFQNSKITPASLLDLCAAPGGKLIRAHELFPKSLLFANDVSENKIKRLNDNLARFHIDATITIAKGEDFSSDKLFDLIILDVPCSNSGVFHKKAESRWRLSTSSLAALNQTQMTLIQKALTLLAPGGKIWYMTCSILPEENLAFLEEIKHKLNFRIQSPLTVFPENDQDGGFGAIIEA